MSDATDNRFYREPQPSSKEKVWSDDRIKDELRDYDPSLPSHHVAIIFNQALALIEHREAYWEQFDHVPKGSSAPEPSAGYVAATNGFGISGVWCVTCGAAQGDAHLEGCPASPPCAEWRPFDPEKPPSGHVLIATEDGWVTEADYAARGFWRCDRMLSGKVTHWMPLPSSPVTKSEGR